MLKRAFIGICFLIVSSLVLAQNDSSQFNGYSWFDEGISFEYSLSLADNAVSRFVPAGGGSPEKTQIVFENYHADRGWLPTGAEIDVMPVCTLGQDQVAYFLHLDRPELDKTSLQVLDLAEGASSAVGQVLPLAFQTGQGIRFVALITQPNGQIELSYQYQAISADYAFAISASFPVSMQGLDVVDAQTLDSLKPSDFVPDLDLLDAAVHSLYVPTPQTSFVTAQTDGQVDYENVHFVYDESLAYRIVVDNVPPVKASEENMPMYGPSPSYLQFSFAGYPATGQFQFAQVFVMPVDEFQPEGEWYGMELARLQNLMAQHPELESHAGVRDNPLPILPPINAAQTIVSHPQYIHFASGEGLRYIAFYAQDSIPVSARDLFYVFVGMSDDGRQIVAAHFPLYAGFLPDGRTVYNIQDYEQFMMNYQRYLDGLLLQVDVMAESAYEPQIKLLDDLISSIELK